MLGSLNQRSAKNQRTNRSDMSYRTDLHGVDERSLVSCCFDEIHVGLGIAMGILCEKMLDALIIDRAREEEALSILAAQHLQLLVLLFGFDTFGDDFHPEVTRESGNGTNDSVVVIRRQARHERPIDLEVVEWKTMQVA